MFEYEELRVGAPLDPLKVYRYVKDINIEGKDGYMDHI